MPPAESFGELLRRLRVEASRTQEEQAEVVNAVSGRGTLTRREISRYENNENIPTNHTVAHIAIACGVSSDYLRKEAADARERRRRRGEGREEEEADDMKRRTVLEGAILGASAASAAEPWQRLAHALGRGRRLDAQAAGELKSRSDALHISELQLSADQLRSQVEAHLDAITAALPRAGEHEKTLVIAAGETAALAGWLAWDLGDHGTARAYYRVTADCAETAGHPPLRALALGYASYGAADPTQAIELLTLAAENVRGPGSATAATWLHARHAEEAAAIGDTTAALRALDRAQTAYDYADYSAEQSWVRFMSPARVDSLVLSVYGRLAHPELTDTVSAATDRLGTDRSEAGVVILGDIAAALLQSGDQERGVHVAADFAAAAAARPNTMGRHRALTIMSRLPARERDLAEHFRVLAS